MLYKGGTKVGYSRNDSFECKLKESKLQTQGNSKPLEFKMMTLGKLKL